MKNIIVAEDDKFLSKAYTLKLQKEGYQVTTCFDGAKLLELMNANHYDLVILDLVMPIKDGFTALEEIKQNPKTKNIPVVVASNLGQPEDVDRAKKLGASDYVVKSDLSLDHLIAKIKDLLA